MISNLSFLILIGASAATAGAHAPAPGSFGFNWLAADSHCKKLSAHDLSKVSQCTASNNAFGLSSKSQLCKVDSHVEYMVYKTQAQCQEALETMQANGP